MYVGVNQMCHKKVLVRTKLILPPFSILRDPDWGFSSGENGVSAAVNQTIYGASTRLLLSVLQTCKGFCVLAKDFVFLKYRSSSTTHIA